MGGLDEKPQSALLRSRLLSSMRESRPLLNLLLLAAFFLCGLVYLTEPEAAPGITHRAHRAPRRSLAPHTGPTPHVVEESSGPPHVSGVNVTFLSWKPRVILARNFLSTAECEHMIAVAARSMQRSSVVSNNDGSSVLDNIRTSSGTFITHGEDGVIDAVLRRVAEFSMLPTEHQEALQILHYGRAEKYGAHMDTFHLPNMITREHGLQRVATALMFLNTPIRGGETVFPNLEPAGSQEGLSDCAKEGLAHKPQAGDLILFWSLSPSGEVEMGATHGACPVIEGEKWSAVRVSDCTYLPSVSLRPQPLWMHQAPFQPEHEKRTVVHKECQDEHAMCRSWAKAGECDGNRRFMVGTRTEDGPGVCRRSCNACPYPAALR